MDIIISQHKDGSTITVDSNPKVWINLSASGRANRNAEAIFEHVEKP